MVISFKLKATTKYEKKKKLSANFKKIRRQIKTVGRSDSACVQFVWSLVSTNNVSSDYVGFFSLVVFFYLIDPFSPAHDTKTNGFALRHKSKFER